MLTYSWQPDTSPTTTNTTTSSRWTNNYFISRLKQHHLYKIVSACRPWRLLNDKNSVSCPQNFTDVFYRFKTNLSYFYVNFAIIILSFIYINVFFNIFSCAVFYLIYIKDSDEPPVICGRPINLPIILPVLVVLSVLWTLLIGSTGNVFVGLAFGVVCVLSYLVFRRYDDLYLDELETGLLAEPLLSQQHGGQLTPSTSSSYTLTCVNDD